MRKTKYNGASYERIYRIWNNMRYRCYDKNHKSYKHYGMIGITVCDEWNSSFMSFRKWATENGYKDELTIDRIDGTKGYEPKNCRFATMQEQQRNRKSNRILLTKDGPMLLIEAIQKYNIKKSTLRKRIAKGWTVDEAITVPTNMFYSRRGRNKSQEQKGR